MPDRHYEDPRLAEIYDIDSGWSKDRDFYLALAEGGRKRVLDLGCGTGLLCDAYAAKGLHVTGVDPSATMLDVARRKPHGATIEWVDAVAQAYASEKRFDLIIMTGHAFQCLLDDADIRAACAVMRKHLGQDGRIVFESRNLNIDWSERWDYAIELACSTGSVRESRRFLNMDNERMTFELRYQFDDAQLVSQSELRFASRVTIEEHLAAAGLRCEKVLGDWDGKPFDEQASEEMIFFARL